jgi:hypothetical protein
MEPDHAFQEGLALIKRNSLQANQLIHRILNLHHGKVGERNYHNLSELVTEILELVQKIVPRQIRIETEFPAETLPVYADAVEFRQVLINLALNSVDAMPQGGRLRFRISRHESYPPQAHAQGTPPRSPCVCLATEDDGCGIPAQHLANVFDPFFTTKSAEKGSGLGLYNARLFAEKHHGAVSVDSVEKKGTTVRLWLPEADFTEGNQAEPEPAPRRTLVVFGPAGEALDSTTEFLRGSGFSVVAASPPQDASQLLEARDYLVAGVLLLATGGDPCFSRLAAAARQTGSPIKVIVQATACNQDELDAELLEGADLVLPPDLKRTEILTRINALFQEPPRVSANL